MNNRIFNNLVKKIALNDFNRNFKGNTSNKSLHGNVGGQFNPNTDTITVEGKYYKEFGKTLFVAMIKHELCHYFIWHAGDYKEMHGKKFMKLLHKVHGIRFAPTLTRPAIIYKCQTCHNIFAYREDKKYCPICNHKLREISRNTKVTHKVHNKKAKMKAKIQKCLKKATPMQKSFIKAMIIPTMKQKNEI